MFTLGDKVLVLLPVPGATFHAKFSGPYTVQEKLSDLDYVISTPDRHQFSRVWHVNMLTTYVVCEMIVVPKPSLSLAQMNLLFYCLP